MTIRDASVDVAFRLREGGDRENPDDWEYRGPAEMESAARDAFAGCLSVRPPWIKVPARDGHVETWINPSILPILRRWRNSERRQG